MEETKKQKRSNLMNRSAFKNTKISSPEAVTVKHTARSIQLTTDTLSCCRCLKNSWKVLGWNLHVCIPQEEHLSGFQKERSSECIRGYDSIDRDRECIRVYNSIGIVNVLVYDSI